MDAIFSRLDNPSGDENEQKNNGVALSDLSHLPAEERKLIRYVIRNSGMTYNELVSALPDIYDDREISADEFSLHLKKAVADGYVIEEALSDGAVYRARLRRRERKPTLNGIFDALDKPDDSGQTPASAINPELRRTRSKLADSLLADLSQPLPTTPTNQPTDDETRRNVDSLMSDLFNTGRSSVKKRSQQNDDENRVIEKEKAQRKEEGDSLLSDLSAAGRRQTEQGQKKPKERKKGFMGRLFKDDP